MEEGDPGSDSDFEIDAKKEVSSMRPIGVFLCVCLTECVWDFMYL